VKYEEHKAQLLLNSHVQILMYGPDLKMPLNYSSLAADQLLQTWVWLQPKQHGATGHTCCIQ